MFDLRTALLKKGEVESARLDAFAFRQRARTMRLLAEALGRDPASLVPLVAHHDDAAILARIGAESGAARGAHDALYRACAAQARAALIGEVGDPAPHRLA